MKNQDPQDKNEQTSATMNEEHAPTTNRKQSLNLKVRTRVGMAARSGIQTGSGTMTTQDSNESRSMPSAMST